jgi:5'-nucleotidase
LSVLKRRGRLAAVAAALALGLTPLTVAAGPGASAAPSEPTVRTAEDRAGPAKAKKRKHVRLRLFAINDFHGQLETVDAGSSSGNINGIPAGGAAYLATHLKKLRQQARAQGHRTLTVAAGDLVGATPLLSAAFYDEPTIQAMNRIGLDIASVGNHEFDEGFRELRRLQRGGCRADAGNSDSCPDPDRPFAGADFRYLAANVKHRSTGKTLFPAYQIRKVRGIKVGFIGLTLQDTPNIVTAEGVRGLRFTDEVRTVRRLMPELRRKGVRSIVVLLHEGGVLEDRTQYNGCYKMSGDGFDIARRLPAAVDVVVSGHTHQGYNCKVRDPSGRPRLFTSAASVGRLVTDISLRIDRRSKDIVRPAARARNRIVTNDDGTRAHQGILRLIARYRTLVEPIANEVLGQISPAGESNTLPRPSPVVEDFELGNLIADSQLADDSTIPAGGEAPVVALMNPGGIRADLAEDADGDVTYGAAFSVQPFNNYLVTKTFTGAELLAVLEEQWNGDNEGPAADNKILQIAGFEYAYSRDAAESTDESVTAVVPGSVLVDLDGDGDPETPLEPSGEYRVVLNSFLAGGGDGFATLGDGADPYFGGLDIDAMAAFLGAVPAYTPPATDRITVVD